MRRSRLFPAKKQSRWMEVNLFTSRRYQEGNEVELHQDTQHNAVLHPHTVSS